MEFFDTTLIVRPVSEQSWAEGGVLPQFLAAGIDEPGDLPSRIYSPRSAFALLSFLPKEIYGWSHVRGRWYEPLERLKSQQEKFESLGVSGTNRREGGEEMFIYSASRDLDDLLSSLDLEPWGDYAFGVSDENPLETLLETDLSPSSQLLKGAFVELIELPWNGAFWTHGICCSSLGDVKRAAVESPNVEFVASEICICEIDVSGEGRSDWALFRHTN